MSGMQSAAAMQMRRIKLQQEIAHLRANYGLHLFFHSRTTVISMHWWEKGDKLVSALTPKKLKQMFPAALHVTIETNTTAAAAASSSSSSSNNQNDTIIICSIKPYANHVCPDLVTAAGGTVFSFCAELLAEVFRACRSIYKRCGRAAQEHHALAGTIPSWLVDKVNNTATEEDQEQQLAEQRAKRNMLTPDQKAALLLFTSPPVRRHPGVPDSDACVRLYSPNEYK
jgi:hypothetical protein